jgi:hypothetical protein
MADFVAARQASMRTLAPVSPGGIAKRFVRSTRMMDVAHHFLVIDSSFAQVMVAYARWLLSLC